MLFQEKFQDWICNHFDATHFLHQLKVPRVNLGSNPAKVLKFCVSQNLRRIDVDMSYRSSPPFTAVHFNDRALFVISDLKIRPLRFRYDIQIPESKFGLIFLCPRSR